MRARLLLGLAVVFAFGCGERSGRGQAPGTDSGRRIKPRTERLAPRSCGHTDEVKFEQLTSFDHRPIVYLRWEESRSGAETILATCFRSGVIA